MLRTALTLATCFLFCYLASCGGGDGLGGRRQDGGTDARPGNVMKDATAPDGTCTSLGGVLFRMEAPPHDGGYSYRSSFGDPGDGVWWYSVETPDRSTLSIFLPPGASTLCETCEPRPNPIGQGCGPIPDGGITGGWGGYTITGTSTCQPAPMSSYSAPAGCATIQCLPAGRYVVKMCAGGGPCASAETCIDVPFDFPTDHEVVGHLPP